MDADPSQQPALTAIIVAAGSSRRMGFDKLRADLAGSPVLAWTISAFDSCSAVAEIIILTRAGGEKELAQLVREAAFQKVRAILPGGAARHLTVWNGIQAVKPDAPFVAVHDGARPLVTPRLIEACLARARETSAACAAAPVTDTLKRADEGGLILGGVDRTALWSMQTPQIFATSLLRRAYEAVLAEGGAVTDEASAVERLGEPVALVENDDWNFKITYPRDLALAKLVLAHRK